MKESGNSGVPVSADAIARQAEAGKDVSRFFKGEGRMVQPTQQDLDRDCMEQRDRDRWKKG
jgi:hypothetical protein